MNSSKDQKSNVILVTGPSGAGRSTAINAFEDLDYETVGNMPLALMQPLLQGPSVGRPIALGIAARTRDFSVQGVLDLLDGDFQDHGFEISLLFLTCGTEALLRRYSETRRRHPMVPDQAPIVGIEQEKEILTKLRLRADVLLDTTMMTPHDLKAEVGRLFGPDSGANLSVSVQSFSYKRGVPRGIDMVLDCRFLKNPYWEQALRGKNGMDAAVQDYVQSDPRYAEFFERLAGMAKMLLPAYREEGKAHLSIGLGCTGGQHRSVAVAENLAATLAADGWQVSRRHREMERQTRERREVEQRNGA